MQPYPGANRSGVTGHHATCLVRVEEDLDRSLPGVVLIHRIFDWNGGASYQRDYDFLITESDVLWEKEDRLTKLIVFDPPLSIRQSLMPKVVMQASGAVKSTASVDAATAAGVNRSNLALGVACNGSADVYKRVGDAGSIHYGDGHPGELNSERMQIRAAPPDLSDGECMGFRRQLDILQYQMSMYRDEEGKYRVKWQQDSYQGRRKYIDQPTRARAMQQLRARIDSHCAHQNNTQAQRAAHTANYMSEKCAAARVELKALERPTARSTDDELDEKRRTVRVYCGR